jgi:phenylacetate-coenzyme A ligase PaaK-like adenylate-forming protein
MLINPGALVAALAAMPALDEFQVVVRREKESDPYSMDELAVRIACRQSPEKLVQEVAARALEVTRVRAKVELVEAKEIYDPGRQTKAKRFVDLRK